jgi:hypothetical protein
MSETLDDFTAEIADQVESFVFAVTEVARGDAPEQAVSMLLLEVSQLLLAGGRLGAIVDVVPEDAFEADPGPDPDADELRGALRTLLGPIDEYTEVFDPYAGEPELLTSRLSDDLSEIAATLVHGLKHYKAGRSTEALWWWQFSYLSNWGSTAGAALRALQSVVSHVRLDGGAEASADAHAATIISEAVAAAE